METTGVKHVRNEVKKAGKEVKLEAKEESVALQDRVDDVRDMVEDIRERAALAIHERPYLLPVATGVLGLGVGVLIGSKLSRIMLLAAAGALMSDKVREQIARVSRDVIAEFASKFSTEGDVDEVDLVEPSVT